MESLGDSRQPAELNLWRWVPTAGVADQLSRGAKAGRSGRGQEGATGQKKEKYTPTPTPPHPPVLVWPHRSTQHTTSKVDLHVPGNVTLCLETLATNITLEIPQASVS